QDFQLAVGQVLLRQVGTGSDVAVREVVVGDGLEQLVELAGAQAAALVGRQQFALPTFANQGRALQADAANLETARLLDRNGRRARRLAPGQLLQVLQALALFFEQALLAVAD